MSSLETCEFIEYFFLNLYRIILIVPKDSWFFVKVDPLAEVSNLVVIRTQLFFAKRHKQDLFWDRLTNFSNNSFLSAVL